MEKFICMKMDLAIINLQWLICYKTKKKKKKKKTQPTKILCIDSVGLVYSPARRAKNGLEPGNSFCWFY